LEEWAISHMAAEAMAARGVSCLRSMLACKNLRAWEQAKRC
jgi:hypothetical protein